MGKIQPAVELRLANGEPALAGLLLEQNRVCSLGKQA
jgi:hypothetical protein